MRYWRSGPRFDGVCRRRPALGSWCFGVDSADFFGGLARVSAASPRSWVLTVLSSWRVGSRPAQRLRRRWRGRGVVGVVAPVPLLTLSRSQVGEQKKNAGIRDAPPPFFFRPCGAWLYLQVFAVFVGDGSFFPGALSWRLFVFVLSIFWWDVSRQESGRF